MKHFPKTVQIVILSLALTSTCQASIVTLGAGFAGPFANTSDGDRVIGGHMRVGTFIGAPASSSIGDIELVFREFSAGSTGGNGFMGSTYSNGSATAFDERQVYVWVFDTPDPGDATEHAVFTNPLTTPSTGNPWQFPIHDGSGRDSILLNLTSVYTDADTSITPGASFETSVGGLLLTPIPEPSGALLLAFFALGIALRRRR